MKLWNRRSHEPRGVLNLVENRLMAFVLIVTALTASCGFDEPLPPQIQDLKMGSSSSSVIDRIKSTGTYESGVNPGDQRMKLTWMVPRSPYYQNVVFLFTEKDRLYLIRFSLRQDLRDNLRQLKKAFFDKFNISSEAPGKLRVKDQDVVTYTPQDGDYNFFEITDTKTGEKWFELFSNDISAKDRPKKNEENKTGGEKT
jgi:hypothetical protein